MPMRRETTRAWQLITRWLVFVGLVGILASFAIVKITESWQSVGAWATFGASFVVAFVCLVLNIGWFWTLTMNKRALFALNVTAMIVLAGAILFGVNYLAERRLPMGLRRIDVTSRGLYKLSTQTRNLLGDLDKDVRVCALLSNAKIAEKLQDFPYVSQVRDLLEEYAAASAKVTVEYVDMMRDPAAAWDFIIWSKLPKVLRDHKVDPDAFKKAFGKHRVDTVLGFNLVRTIDTWDGPESRIVAMAETKAGSSIEGLQFGKQFTKEELAQLRKEFKAKTEKETTRLKGLLTGIKALLAEAKLDDKKQADLLKAIKGMDVPEPEANSVIFVCVDKSKHVKSADMVHSDYGRSQSPEQDTKKTFKGEDAFTAAMKEIIEAEQMTVCFIEGHGERRVGEYGEQGYSQAKSALEKANYKVESLDLNRDRKIPDKCNVLVAAAPLLPYDPGEISLIKAYLDKGGALLAMFEPLTPSFQRFQRRPSTLAKLLAGYNVDVRENVTVLDVAYVLELTRKGFEQVPKIQGTVNVTQYPDHRIVREMQNKGTRFRWACYVDKAAKGSDARLSAVRLLESSKQGWGETDQAMLRRQSAENTEGQDIAAPVPIGVAAESLKEGDAKGTRMVVIGDADFACNAFREVRPNFDLFVNSVSWLAGKESQIGIAPPSGETAVLSVSPRETRILLYGTVVALPVAWILFGLLVFMVRSLRGGGLSRATAAKLGLPLGLLLVLVGAAIAAFEARFTGYSVPVLAAGAAVALVSLLMGKDFVRGLFRRRAVAGANTAVMVVLAAVVLGMACFVADRSYLRFDWTRGNKHALEAPALEVAQKVSRLVRVYALYLAGAAAHHPVLSKVEDALEEFAYHSRYIDVEHVPYDKDKREAFFHGIGIQPNERTLVVFRSADQVRAVTFDELIIQERMPPQMMMQMRMPQPPPRFRGQEAFASAVASVTSETGTTIYFTTGHGERDISDFKGEGFGELHNVLRRKGFAVKTLDLAEADEAPEDCKLLVVAAPTKPLTPQAMDVLRRYCEANGRLFVMLEPAVGKRAPSGLAELLSQYKINVDESVLVVDSGEQVRLTQRGLTRVQQASVQVRVADQGYQDHTINENMRGLPTLFHVACEVGAEETPEQPQYPGAPPPRDDQSPYTAKKLLEASDQGWGETSVGADGSATYSDSDDKKGPVPFAACVEPKAKPRMPWGPPPGDEDPAGPRIVCVGDADFASSQILTAGNNANEEFLMRCVSWLTKSEGEIKIPAVKIEPERMAELKSRQKGWALAICLAGLPLVWVTLGLLVWGFRRVQA